ncbi:hypothetical protein M3Y98_00654800 [Aphelenchoides besseyi]|nr:hypothetical protein M3Y98_00654800 [Aphelenchoides besseyi]KAI6208715.1 hypothetical protein M3Y96_00144300 [Aphelenchoides besseyi]
MLNQNRSDATFDQSDRQPNGRPMNPQNRFHPNSQQTGDVGPYNTRVFYNQQISAHQRSHFNRQSFAQQTAVNQSGPLLSSVGTQPRDQHRSRALTSRPPRSTFSRPPRNPTVVVNFQKLPLPLGDVSLDPTVLPLGARRATSPVTIQNPIAPGQNEILADKDRVFCHCVRYVEQSTHSETNYSYKYRDFNERMVKVSVVVSGHYADCGDDGKSGDVEEGVQDDVDEEGFGDLVYDYRPQNTQGINSKFQKDKRRVLDFLADMVDGPWDLSNLKRIRFVCSSLQMYDTVDQQASPGELAFFEFNFQNGIIDTFHSFMRSAAKLTPEDKNRLTSFKHLNMLDAEMASRGPRLSSVAYEIFCRLQPIEAANQRNEKRGIYAITNFVDLNRSVLPNLSPEYAKLLWNRTNDQCPILAGPWGCRWILVLDHELDTMRTGYSTMGKVLEETLKIQLDLNDDRFVLLSAFIHALAEFLEIETNKELLEKLRILGTEKAREFDKQNKNHSLCTFHDGVDSFCCAFSATLGMCNILDRSFRSKFRNEMLPDLDEEALEKL